MAGKITPEGGEIKVRKSKKKCHFKTSLRALLVWSDTKLDFVRKSPQSKKNIEKSESLPGQLINNRKLAGFAFQISQESISRKDFILRAILNIDIRFSGLESKGNSSIFR